MLGKLGTSSTSLARKVDKLDKVNKQVQKARVVLQGALKRLYEVVRELNRRFMVVVSGGNTVVTVHGRGDFSAGCG
ncbi:hypothetical protein LR48_Vigan07g072200 [Vigna angularis]|uniref:Uncharacterized protein n=1 Tax=Phaseolus angularis TaxID=3914 RepID=A0A0L9UW88_PHAAN|nr:hypothetical protein LR48_Vigan07g072200 [Vigna angularis]